MQIQKAVSAQLQSKHTLPFDFAEHHSIGTITVGVSNGRYPRLSQAHTVIHF